RRLEVGCIVVIRWKMKIIDRAAVLKTHVGCDQKDSRRLLSEPLPRQTAAGIDQDRKGEPPFPRRAAQFVGSFLLPGSHSQQCDVRMTFAKRVQIFVVSQAVGTDARPEDDHGGCLIFQFATETPRDSLKVPEGEIQNSAAD